jgi:hypothetical protein
VSQIKCGYVIIFGTIYMDIRSEKLFRDGSNVKNSEPNLKTKVGQKGRHLYSKRGNYV